MSNSTPHASDCHLLNDFSTSSGYNVLTYAIKNSTGKNAAASLELLSKLISINSSSEAKNEEALGVLAKLARGCTPMLEGKRTSYDRAREASKIAMRRFQGEDEDDDKVVKVSGAVHSFPSVISLHLNLTTASLTPPRTPLKRTMNPSAQKSSS